MCALHTAWHADGRGDRVASEEGWRLERETSSRETDESTGVPKSLHELLLLLHGSSARVLLQTSPVQTLRRLTESVLCKQVLLQGTTPDPASNPLLPARESATVRK